MEQETKDATSDIMEATYQAIVKNGFNELTIEKIAKEYDKGKSNIYYHFDNKNQLILEYFDHLNQIVESELIDSDGTPEKRLECFLTNALAIENEEMWKFRTALLEMRVQAPHNEEFAEKFRILEQSVNSMLEEIFIEAGSENPRKKAEIVHSAVEGHMDKSISQQRREGAKDLKNWLMELL